MATISRFPSAIALLTALSVFQFVAATTNTCYFPDSNIASSYVPCSPTGDGGCCASGDYCTQWGYCLSISKGYHYRGACTDNTWANPSCPDYCLANTNSGNSSLVNVIACDVASTSGSWCCAYDGNCCSNSSATFIPTFGTIFAEPGSSSTSSASGSASTSSTSTSSSTSSTPTASTSATPSVAQQTSVPNTTAAATSSTKSNSSTIIGAAVGVPLGLIAIAGLFLFFLERKKRKAAESNVPDDEKNTFEYYGGGGGSAPLVPIAAPIRSENTVTPAPNPVYQDREQSVQPHSPPWVPETERKYELSGVREAELETPHY